MIFDVIYYVTNTLFAFLYEVIKFPFAVFGMPLDIGALMHDLKIDQIFGFITDVLLPPGFVLFYFSYVSIVIMIKVVLTIIDVRKGGGL